MASNTSPQIAWEEHVVKDKNHALCDIFSTSGMIIGQVMRVLNPPAANLFSPLVAGSCEIQNGRQTVPIGQYVGFH